MSAALADNLPRLALRLAVGLSLIVGSEPARASPTPSTARCLVDVEVVGGDDPVLLSTLQEIVGRNNLVVRSPDSDAIDAPCAPFASVRVDFETEDVRVVVIDAVDGHLSTRRTLKRDPSSSIMREEVAIVVRSAIDAMLERTREARVVSKEPIRPAVAPPESKPEVYTPASAPWSLDGGAFAFGRTFAVETGLATGFGGLAALGLGQGGLRPSVWLTGSYQLPTSASQNGVEVRANVGSFRLTPTISLHRGELLRLDAGAGIGVDVLAVSASATTPNAHTLPDRIDVVPLVTTLVAARLPTGARTALFVGVCGDIDFAPNRYMVERGATAEPVLELHAIRVGGLIGVTHQLGGGGEPR